MVVSRHVTGEWVHVIDDGMVDDNALPDEVRPTGHIKFEPIWPNVATAGQIAYTLTPITAVIASGVLTDVQGREGVWLPGEVGGVTVRWKATTYLEYRAMEIPYPELVFDLDADARLTALLRSTAPDEFPWVVDPRIEGLLNDATQVLADSQQVLADAQAVQDGIDAAFDAAVDAAEGHASAAAGSASAASGSAGDAAGSAGDAATSASEASGHASGAASSASAASSSAGDAASSASAAQSAAAAASSDAGRAETAANSFDLSAATSTGAPGTDAAVVVTGDGPAYGLDFTIPRGEQGPQGDPGEVSQAALDAAVASLVDGAPEALDTLEELAAALGHDPNFATTVSEAIGKRAKIDGAPEEYDSLGKLVSALIAGELGGGDGVAVGTNAGDLPSPATVNNGIAGGWGAQVSGNDGIAIGTSATSGRGIAIGRSSVSVGSTSVAIAPWAAAEQNGAVAIGDLAQAGALRSTALGANARATADFATALGRHSSASHARSVALGFYATTSADDEVAIGNADAHVKVAGTLDVVGGITVDGEPVGGGSTDASDLTGALTGAVDASAAIVAGTHPTYGPLSMSVLDLLFGLQDFGDMVFPALDSKADTNHTHPISDVSGLEDALDDRPTRDEVEARGPAIERVTELPADPDPDVQYWVVPE